MQKNGTTIWLLKYYNWNFLFILELVMSTVGKQRLQEQPALFWSLLKRVAQNVAFVVPMPASNLEWYWQLLLLLVNGVMDQQFKVFPCRLSSDCNYRKNFPLIYLPISICETELFSNRMAYEYSLSFYNAIDYSEKWAIVARRTRRAWQLDLFIYGVGGVINLAAANEKV